MKGFIYIIDMNRLRILRKQKGITQAEIAKYIGISQNNYSYWENGKVKIDGDSLKKLARFFNVSTDYLLGFESKRDGIVFSDKHGVCIHYELLEEDSKTLKKILDSLSISKKIIDS